MTTTKETILALLETDRDGLYGLQMVKRSDGKLQRGVIYVTLQDMEDDGLIVSTQESQSAIDPQIGIARRIYQITERGRRALAEAGDAGWSVGEVKAVT